MMRFTLLSLSLFVAACSSSKGAGDAQPSSSSSSSPSVSAACETARTAAESAWARQFGRVQELSPEDRAEMAKQHANATASELARLEQEASEGGDDIMLDAVRKTKDAHAACGS